MMTPNFKQYADGLLPVIIQDVSTAKVLMLGFMNEAALNQTKVDGRVVFYSRSKQRLWMKGESSQNYLHVKSMLLDCDADTLLIQVQPSGPVCHTGDDTCFKTKNVANNFLSELESIITERKNGNDSQSYVKSLFDKGMNKIAQKVGEEAIEMIIEAKDSNDALFLNESADLLFHYLILLQAKGYTMDNVIDILKERHKNS
jgi:phosphoribosyl-AMP cyclohydrolase / phosphoribosyl-ATP pyrophosphohydrolase